MNNATTINSLTASNGSTVSAGNIILNGVLSGTGLTTFLSNYVVRSEFLAGSYAFTTLMTANGVNFQIPNTSSNNPITNKIDLKGTGTEITGAFISNHEAFFHSSITVDGNSEFKGNLTLDGDTFTGSITIDGGDLTVNAVNTTLTTSVDATTPSTTSDVAIKRSNNTDALRVKDDGTFDIR